MNSPTVVPAINSGGGASPATEPLHWWRLNTAAGLVPSGDAGIPLDSGSTPTNGNQAAAAAASFIDPSPAGAQFGNALGMDLPVLGGAPTVFLPNTPSGIDFSAFTDGLTLDFWMGGNGAGLNGAAAIRLRDGTGPPANLDFTIVAGDNVLLSYVAGGVPQNLGFLNVPGVSTAIRHFRILVPNSFPGNILIVLDDGAHAMQGVPAVPDIFAGGEDLVFEGLADPFLASGGVFDEVAMFNGLFEGPVGPAAIPTVPGVWPGIND